MADNRRDKGTGSYRQKPNGTWQGRYKGFSCSAKTEAEVKKKLKALVKEVDKDSIEQADNIKTSDNSNPSVMDTKFIEWLDTWLNDYKKISLKPGTYTTYLNYINAYIKPNLENIGLSQISVDHIQSLFSKLTSAGLKPATVAKVKNIINNSLNQAVKNQLIPYNPTQATVAPRQEQQEIRIFTPEEQQRFMAAVKGQNLESFFLTALGTGLRRGELIALTWDNIDFEKKEISVVGSVSRVLDENAKTKTALVLNTPKTRSGRRKVPMIGSIESVLLEHKSRQEEKIKEAGSAWHNNNIVFCSNIGTYQEPRKVATYLDQILNIAGLKHIKFHALRHTFATRMIENGASIKALQEILGHKDASVTLNTYAHVVGSTAHDEIRKIDSLFNLPASNEQEKPQHRTLPTSHNTRKKAKKPQEQVR